MSDTALVFSKHEHFDADGCAVVYDALVTVGEATQGELAAVLELSQQTVYRRLQVMYHAGHVDSRVGVDGFYVWAPVPLAYRRAN